MRAGKLAASISRSYELLLAVVSDNPGWVAFSGGVDSTLVLQAVSEVSLSPIVALFADSPLQSEFDRDNVKRVADQLRVQLEVVPFDPLAMSDFAVNPDNRCYLCKKSIFSEFQSLLPSGLVLMDGTNQDDLSLDRPGHLAVVELGVVSPLALAGLIKSEVRQLARGLGLSNWKRPSASCLATRIPGGVAISQELLRHIEECERLVRLHGFGHIRVRPVVGRTDDVVVELAREEMDRDGFSSCRETISKDLAGIVRGKLMFSGRDGVFF